jgi:hypothetical protein
MVLPRADIRRLCVSPPPAMPADLDQQVSERQMADLLGYIKRVP